MSGFTHVRRHKIAPHVEDILQRQITCRFTGEYTVAQSRTYTRSMCVKSFADASSLGSNNMKMGTKSLTRRLYRSRSAVGPNLQSHERSIGVNRPAIVREVPHCGLFPAFLHFCQNVPHFWLYFETKIAENRNNFSCTETFCPKKLCENVSAGVT